MTFVNFTSRGEWFRLRFTTHYCWHGDVPIVSYLIADVGLLVCVCLFLCFCLWLANIRNLPFTLFLNTPGEITESSHLAKASTHINAKHGGSSEENWGQKHSHLETRDKRTVWLLSFVKPTRVHRLLVCFSISMWHFKFELHCSCLGLSHDYSERTQG